MARFDLQSTNWVWPDVGNAVFVRRAWTDDWVWLPFMFCTEAKESLAPSMPSATLVANFGSIARAEFGSYTIWNPYFVNGAYVKVVAFTRWSRANIWYGVIDTETVVPHGNTNFPQGQQTYTAYGLEHLLNRRPMFGSYTDNGVGSGVTFCDRSVIFNKARDRGTSTIEGNKSGVNSNAFGTLGTEWSNLDVLNYIGTRWINVNSSITFNLAGFTGVLDDIIERHDFHGLTPYDGIERLIDRKRGISWRVVVDANENVYIRIFSLFSEAISSDGFSMPANANQTNVSFGGLANVETDITFDNTTTFDRIVVLGGPIYSMFTLSYTDATLVKDWTTGQEDDYAEGTGTEADSAELHDGERNTDKFEKVYSRHRVPTSWDWFAGDGEGGTQVNATPYVSEGGYVSGDLLANVYNTGKRFERELPLEVEGTASTNPEYRAPFALLEIEDPDDSLLTIWVYAENMDVHGLKRIDLRMADNDLAVELRSVIPHIMGENHFDVTDVGTNETNFTPEIDYTTLLVTVFAKTDGHLKVDTANLGFAGWDVGRTKLIEIPDAIAHYIVPGTVTDVTDGALVKDATGGLERDDSERLRTAMLRAMAWYGTPRAKMGYELGAFTTFLFAGAMVRGMWGSEGWTNINTTVSRRVWRWTPGPNGTKQTTSVVTNFEELDFTAT